RARLTVLLGAALRGEPRPAARAVGGGPRRPRRPRGFKRRRRGREASAGHARGAMVPWRLVRAGSAAGLRRGALPRASGLPRGGPADVPRRGGAPRAGL